MRYGLFLALALATATVVAQDDAPPVTPLVRAQLEVVSLKQQLALATAQLDTCRAQVAPTAYNSTMAALDREAQALVQAFEAEHPGWTLDLKTGQPVKKGGH
jgi:hypothetical protein